MRFNAGVKRSDLKLIHHAVPNVRMLETTPIPPQFMVTRSLIYEELQYYI